ncbi:MAG: hypothetical protein HYX63_04500 [Gammaproteobacteria bacterium]|nr:hypothetical protein [Gammaproteobacteria bacterium]
MTDRLVAQGSLLFNDVSYLNAANTGYVDYRYLQATIGASYLISEKGQVFANVFASDFKTPAIESKSRTYGGQAGVTWRWDPTLETTGSVGWNASTIKFIDQHFALVLNPIPQIITLRNPQAVESNGPIATASIKKIFETVTANLHYSRQVSPTGRGSQRINDEIELGIEKRLSERLAISLGGLRQMRTLDGGIIGGRNVGTFTEDYSEISGTARYQISRSWRINGSYRYGYATNSNGTVTNSATANVILLTLEYYALPKTLWNGY